MCRKLIHVALRLVLPNGSSYVKDPKRRTPIEPRTQADTKEENWFRDASLASRKIPLIRVSASLDADSLRDRRLLVMNDDARAWPLFRGCDAVPSLGETRLGPAEHRLRVP